ASVILGAVGMQALGWAIVVGAFLFVLYWLVRIVKWAWTDTPREQYPTRELTDIEKGGAEAVALLKTGEPLPPEQWGVVVSAISRHDNEGRPICAMCGFAIPEGKSVLLTDDGKRHSLAAGPSRGREGE